jgi:hypothetical protein
MIKKRNLIAPILGVFLICCLPVLLFKITNYDGFNVKKLDDYRILFNIISSVLGMIIGCIGLVLGYVYYVGRNENDIKQIKLKKIGNNVVKLLDECDNLHDHLTFLFDKTVNNQQELDRIRKKILDVFENINLFLELNDEIMNLNEEEIREIVKQYALIEKNQIIMQYSLRQYKRSDLTILKNKYISQRRVIRKICLRKLS